MIDPAFKPEDQRRAARQSAGACRLAYSLSVLKRFLQDARSGEVMAERKAVSGALALIAALEELHRDLDRGAEDLWTLNAALELKGLCARISAALLGPLGLRCEAHADDSYMSADDLALLRQVLPIVLADAAQRAFPVDRDRVVHVRLRKTHLSWCCAVLYLGVTAHLERDGLAEAAELVDAAGGRLHRIQGKFGEGVLIRLGLGDTDPVAASSRFH